MKRDEVLTILAEHKAEIEAFGVTSLALFGSVARDEAGPDSDVDLLVEFERPVGYFHLFRLKDYLEQILACRVDLATPGAIDERLRDRVLKDLIRVA